MTSTATGTTPCCRGNQSKGELQPCYFAEGPTTHNTAVAEPKSFSPCDSRPTAPHQDRHSGEVVRHDCPLPGYVSYHYHQKVHTPNKPQRIIMQTVAADYDRHVLAQIVNRLWENEGLPTLR